MSSYKISSALEQAMKKVLPIPKRPKVYKVYTPKPVSWIPSGKIDNATHRKKLIPFSNIMKEMDSKRGDILGKISGRGWCYILEGLGHIHKGEFLKCANAINDCRKIGLLPVDFTAQDQDPTRSFTEVHEVMGVAPPLQRLKDRVDRLLDYTLPHVTTDYWDDEEYYLMMCTEKIDIRNLFLPICRVFSIPLLNSRGWYTIMPRYRMAKLCQEVEERGLIPVLGLFYDYDITGIKITDTFRAGLNDLEGTTGWNADNLKIERFGLNYKDIVKHDLMWIDNLTSGSGRDPKWHHKDVKEYVQGLAELERQRFGISDYEWDQWTQKRQDKLGIKKCEANAVLRNEETLLLGQRLCIQFILKYYGNDALDRFKEKREKSKEKFKDVYDNPVWKNFQESLDKIIEEHIKPPEILPDDTIISTEKIYEVEIDGKWCGRCPKCRAQFNYFRTYIDRLVRCRYCYTLMKLRKADSWEIEQERRWGL